MAGLALILGILVALTVGNPWMALTRRWTPRLLQGAIMGLGAGVNLSVVAEAGARGAIYTAAGIVFALLLTWGLNRWVRAERATAALIGVGTAICGGSAIAAVAPVIRAKDHEVSASLATVFCLNAVGLLVFPALGRAIGLSEDQFGMWSALAIHDTSSVVGASMQYGERALEVGTTVKLARALWIVPVVFAMGWAWRRAGGEGAERGAVRWPWFILGFALVSAVFTYFRGFSGVGAGVASVARWVLVVTLFLIGTGLNRVALEKTGVRPLALGVALWFCVALGSLAIVSIWS